MGSCLSKDSAEVKAPTKSRITPTKQKLGEKTQPMPQKAATSEGRRLGGEVSEKPTTNKTATKEAAARAAEERYNKNQQKLRESKDKLKTMSKISKSEKNL